MTKYKGPPQPARLLKWKTIPPKMVGDPEWWVDGMNNDLTQKEMWARRCYMVYAAMLAEKRERQWRQDEVNRAEMEYLQILKEQEAFA